MDLMDASGVQELVAAGETLIVEFKRGTRRVLADRDILAAVVCLANGSGGTLLLGVGDDRTITGLEPRHGRVTHAHQVRALIQNRTDPAVATRVELVQIGQVEVAVVQVPDMPTPVGTSEGIYLRRTTKADGSPQCVPYRPHELMSAGFSVAGRDYAEVPALGASMDDLDPAEFDRFRRLCTAAGGDAVLRESSNYEICRALRITRPDRPHDEHVTLGAILLFGWPETIANYVPTAECTFQELSDGRIRTNQTLRFPLFRAAEELYALVEVRNFEDELVLGLHRAAVPKIPHQTVRESIANALVHRDYAELGPVSVQLVEEEFRVRSPGGFPPGITLANILDDSRPRSVVLAEAFRRAGIVDRAGRGVHEMYVSLLRAGRGGPDYTRSNESSVTVAIPTSGADLDMVRFVLRHEEDQQTRLTLQQLRVLHEIKAGGPSTGSELVESLGGRPDAIRTHVAKLSEFGLLESRGVGRNRRHHLTAAFHRAAEDPSAYVRLRDFDPMQQDQMVLSYVDAYGSITRGQAAELCRLTPPQARVVLRRLVDAGELELRGQRRGAHYLRADPSRVASG